ncbi:MAG: hypothetical protein LAO31_06715 [Acidobacteriia bacterium]|nr:hypothetical protein [Terriglobia bacterium]
MADPRTQRRFKLLDVRSEAFHYTCAAPASREGQEKLEEHGGGIFAGAVAL